METMRLHAYRTNGGYLGFDIGSGAEFTLENDINDLNVEIRIGSGVNTNGKIFKPMIRLASDTDSTYEPYTSKTYTIQIGQTVYGGQLDVTRGKMVVDKGYAEFDGSSDEDWSVSSNRFVGTLPSATISDITNVNMSFCNAYEGKNMNTLYANRGTVGWTGVAGTSTSVYVVDNATFPSTKDATAWETYLASNPLQVCYELATPFTIDLTPQQIKLLENTNTISTDYEGDTITLEYQPNNAIGEAVRAVEESYNPEFAVRPVLKKKAFSGTTDSDGSVTLINASDIPSGHKIIPLHITDMTIGGSAGTYFVEYKPYNSGDSVKGYCYTYFNGSQITPVGSAVTGNFYYYELEG